MKFGIDRLLQQSVRRESLKGQRVALLAHPASVSVSTSGSEAGSSDSTKASL